MAEGIYTVQLETWLRTVSARAADEAARIRAGGDARLAAAMEDLCGRADGLAEVVEARRGRSAS